MLDGLEENHKQKLVIMKEKPTAFVLCFMVSIRIPEVDRQVDVAGSFCNAVRGNFDRS